jgi:hypothetical protein
VDVRLVERLAVHDHAALRVTALGGLAAGFGHVVKLPLTGLSLS